MEHLTLLTEDGSSILRKSFKSTLSNSAWDLGSLDKRNSNSLRRLNFNRRLSSSELNLGSSGSFRPILRPTDSIDSDVSSSTNTTIADTNSVDLSSLDSFLGQNSDDFTSTKSDEDTCPVVDGREDSTSEARRIGDKGKLFQAIKQFNLDADRGLKLLEERGFVRMTPESVAQFLFNQERLSKKQIGAVIGGHKDFNKSVLQNFVHLHQFHQVSIVRALRQYLWNFRLPGEALQIDRIMEAFAAAYCKQNPGIFEEQDTCFILAFSIIMLNTALHNPNANINISSEQFINQNRGINSGKDLPSNMLEGIYRSIKAEAFKFPDETYDDLMYTFFSPKHEGWLEKQGGQWRTWKRRWFVLNNRCLYYFQDRNEKRPRGIIPLEGVKVQQIFKMTKDSVFEIFNAFGNSNTIKSAKTDSRGAVVQGNHKHFRSLEGVSSYCKICS